MNVQARVRLPKLRLMGWSASQTDESYNSQRLQPATVRMMHRGRVVSGATRDRITFNPEDLMASSKQRQAASKNVKKAGAAAKRKGTLKKLSKKTKTALGKQANKVKRQRAKA